MSPVRHIHTFLMTTFAIRSHTGLVCLMGALVMCCGIGCRSQSNVKLRTQPYSPLVDRLKLTATGGPEPTDRTIQLLRRNDLLDSYDDHPSIALQQLEEMENDETPDISYALAELHFIRAAKVEFTKKNRALEHYWSTVAHSYRYLFSPRAMPPNPYDPGFRAACDLYNGALEHCLRIASEQGTLKPGEKIQIRIGDRTTDLEIAPKGFRWRPEDFERFEFVSDYRIEGLTNEYKTYGLGVPLIAVRGKMNAGNPEQGYYPEGLSFPVTAFLKLGHESARSCTLELHDPLASTEVEVAGVQVPLESDISTPLAYFLDNPVFSTNDYLGFFRPEKAQKAAGIYMLQPYQPGKIPVLMVHGLLSSPMTWMEMFNDLRSHPEIRSRYQFWFYQYPTGQPFLVSAAQMRKDLQKLRRVIDPGFQQPELDRMVLVGHSMGGLVSRLQTLDSGDEFWNIVSDKPLDEFRAGPEVRSKIKQTFFFDKNPSIRRVITIGTPHRGSNYSNRITRWLSRKFVQLPMTIMQVPSQFLRLNPNSIREKDLFQGRTSVDGLSPDSPVLQAMLDVPLPENVLYHNVVGISEGDKKSGGDGIVPFTSSHLDNVDSEIVVKADHTSIPQHPRTVLEVRRILLEQLDEIVLAHDERTEPGHNAGSAHRQRINQAQWRRRKGSTTQSYNHNWSTLP